MSAPEASTSAVASTSGDHPAPASDLDDPAFLAGDRREVYRQLRDDAPVFTLGPPGHETWVVSRYPDVQAVLREPSSRMQPSGIEAPPWMPDGPTRRRLTANLVQTDRPVHTRLRGIVGPFFTARPSEQMRDVAAATVARELDAIATTGGAFDAVVDLAAEIPKGVLRLLIGMPDEDWALMTQNQLDFLAIFSPFPLDAKAMAHLDEVSRFDFDHFDGLLGRITEPTALVVRLLEAEEVGELSHDEVLSIMHTVLDAGFETTRTSISNLVELFATQPTLFDRVRRDPTLVNGVVEEVLRVQAPVQANTRILTAEHLCTDGTAIPAHAQVLALIGAANIDDQTFTDPDTVEPGRTNASRHLTFGGGLHHCLGAPLARIQLQETVKGLAERFARIELVGEPGPRFPSLIFPSLSSLTVRATLP